MHVDRRLRGCALVASAAAILAACGGGSPAPPATPASTVPPTAAATPAAPVTTAPAPTATATSTPAATPAPPPAAAPSPTPGATRAPIEYAPLALADPRALPPGATLYLREYGGCMGPQWWRRAVATEAGELAWDDPLARLPASGADPSPEGWPPQLAGVSASGRTLVASVCERGTCGFLDQMDEDSLQALWGSLDGGETWERWGDHRGGRVRAVSEEDAAVVDADGRLRGFRSGEVWTPGEEPPGPWVLSSVEARLGHEEREPGQLDRFLHFDDQGQRLGASSWGGGESYESHRPLQIVDHLEGQLYVGFLGSLACRDGTKTVLVDFGSRTVHAIPGLDPEVDGISPVLYAARLMEPPLSPSGTPDGPVGPGSPLPATPDEGMDEDPLAAGLAERVLASVRDEFGEAAEALTAHAFPVGEGGEQGALWAVVSNGALPARVDDDGNLTGFRYLVALYRRNADATWSEALDALTLETDPLRVDVEVHETGPRRARGSAPLIVMRGGTGAHSGTLDIALVEGARLRPVVSHISARPGAGRVADLDGDGVLEIVLDSSNPYVFCYACAVEERSELLYRWDGVAYAAVAIEAPEDLEGGPAEGARRVVALAGANLWREAGALAVETSRLAPEHEGLRWLSIAVSRTAALRLVYAGSAGQPLLTNVFAGEYGAAYELMRALAPEEAFAPDGPLVAGTAAETDLPTMAAHLLAYADGALKARNDDPAVHAVRALGRALASPDDLAPARSSIARALRLAPEDRFLQAAQAFLESMERAQGPAPEAAGPG